MQKDTIESPYSYYKRAKTALEVLESKNNELFHALDKISVLEANLDSITQNITKAYDADVKTSKTALKAKVDGDPLVLEAKQALKEAKANKAKLEAVREYLEKQYEIEKKMISAVVDWEIYMSGGSMNIKEKVNK